MSGHTTLCAEVVGTSARAVKVLLDGSEVWIPRSVCIDGDTLDEGDEDLMVAVWWLKENGHD